MKGDVVEGGEEAVAPLLLGGVDAVPLLPLVPLHLPVVVGMGDVVEEEEGGGDVVVEVVAVEEDVVVDGEEVGEVAVVMMVVAGAVGVVVDKIAVNAGIGWRVVVKFYFVFSLLLVFIYLFIKLINTNPSSGLISTRGDNPLPKIATSLSGLSPR